MGSEKWSKNEKLTEDEVNNIVDFFYKEELQLTNKQYFDYVTDMRTSEFRLALEED